MELHDRPYARSFLPSLRRDLPDEPHITIARDASPPKVESAFEAARERFGREFSDVLREVTLLAVERDGRIERLADIALHSA